MKKGLFSRRENGKVGFFRSNINAGENCYAFNIWASSLERNEPMFDLMENCEVNGNFKLGVAELPETGEQSKAPILYMGEVTSDGKLTLTDHTHQKTYEGTYTLTQKTPEEMRYDITLDGKTGYATVAMTTYADQSQAPTLPITLEGYSLSFYA